MARIAGVDLPREKRAEIGFENFSRREQEKQPQSMR